MLFNNLKLYFSDLWKATWRIPLVIVVLVIGIATLSQYTKWLTKPESIPDVMFHVSSEFSYSILTVPLFLLLLYFVLHPLFDDHRLVRYKNRQELFVRVTFGTLLMVVLYILTYLCIGFFYGWSITETLNNPYDTIDGPPYRLYEDQINLSWFQTPYMIVRILLTQIFAFFIIGLLAAVLFVIFEKFIFVFFIIEGFLLVDLSLASLIQKTIFSMQSSISIDGWGGYSQLFGLLFYFFGIVIVLLVVLYTVIHNKDFILDSRESN